MVFVISGPSGCGKSTLIREVRKTVAGLGFSVSHTTRPPRPSEKDGVHYHFVTDAVFGRLVRAGKFVEWARVHGHRYGTSWAELRRRRPERDLLLDIDVQGARQVRRKAPEACLVFVMPPAAAELRRRLKKRGEDAPEALERRLRNARTEVRAFPEFDYVVVNDDLRKAVEELRTIIAAARLRPAARSAALRPILKSFARRTPAGARREKGRR
jgi:guanylate kinase